MYCELAMHQQIVSDPSKLPGHQNSTVISNLFREFSEPWRKLAERHIREVGHRVKGFAAELLLHLTDENTAANIQEWLNVRLEKNIKEGLDELEKLLKAHGRPHTNNPRYLTEWSNTLKEAQPFLEEEDPQGMQRVFAKIAVRETRAYYRIARDNFVDNVPALTIWSPIVDALREAFSPNRVSQMNDDLVAKLAAEPAQIVARRAELEADLKLLKSARDEFERQLMAHRVGMFSPASTDGVVF